LEKKKKEEPQPTRIRQTQRLKGVGTCRELEKVKSRDTKRETETEGFGRNLMTILMGGSFRHIGSEPAVKKPRIEVTSRENGGE